LVGIYGEAGFYARPLSAKEEATPPFGHPSIEGKKGGSAVPLPLCGGVAA